MSTETGSNDVSMKEAKSDEEDSNKLELSTAKFVNDKEKDPLLASPSDCVREGDFVILAFGDGRKNFAQCVKSWNGKSPPVKINKRSYPTANLINYYRVDDEDHRLPSS